MYVKWTGDLQGRGTKVTVHPQYISFERQQIYREVFWDLGAHEERSPVGLKESYLLLLPITPQSPALSTCKMTLDMPVLMVFYTLRLLLSDEPLGSSGSTLLCLKVVS